MVWSPRSRCGAGTLDIQVRSRRLDPLAGRPGAQINLSSIPVAGDFGGLMFVVGSIVIVLLGFPDVRWFVLGSIAAGSVMAAGLFAWRSTHLDRVPPAVSFRGR